MTTNAQTPQADAGRGSGDPATRSRGRRRRSGARRSGGPRREAWVAPSEELLAKRRAAIPSISYSEQLPVSARREDIAAAIRDHQVVIVAGETGSGKTTQIPKICLELGYGIEGSIGHTQPRRLAARTVAERIAEELGVQMGGAVGYQVRFTDHVSETTLVKLMTDGILLAEIQRDPLLRRYQVIIVDEAHERSLNIDFILGYLKRLLPQRPDLKVVITSATIDSARFAEHFGPRDRPAPVIEVSGRTYPVELRYRPLVPDVGDESEQGEAPPPGREEAIDQTTGIVQACDELMAEGPGDILVFCSGEREIRDGADALAEHLGARYTRPGERSTVPGAVEVLPLYARLSAAEQHRVFEAHTTRRIVLATNVAETSLTVPGIRYVVDPGTARISRYSSRTKVQRLPIEAVSQASANQRAGRCGRVADGICIRLYSQADYDSRPEFTEPEILRTSLASVILQMTALGLGDVAAFPFVDAPDARAVRDGMQLLTELHALEVTASARRGGDASGNRLTDVGRKLAQLPIDPRLGRMLVEAERLGCVREVMVIVAALSVQDVRERPADAQQQADEKHRRFADPTSDFLSLLKLWDYLREQQNELSGSAFRRLCRAEFLHHLRVREWQDVHSQLRQLAKPLGMHVNPRDRGATDPDRVHQALLAGLLSHIGAYDERKRDYLGARGTRFVIFPGSGLAKKAPAWVMASELVETSRLFARTVARIQPEWVEPLAEHLLKRTYSEPHWSSKQGAAMVKEKVLLYGIAIIADRSVPYARVDPADARDLFIRHALVEGDWRTHHRFVKDNEAVRAEAEELEARSRRRDLMVDDDALVAFYDARLPASVTGARSFDAWWKKVRQETPDLLTLTLEDLIPDAGSASDPHLFPDSWRQGDLELPLTYQFAPGDDADGVTVHVPIAVLPRLRPNGFDWLVPGLADELAVATIRAFPKPVRVQLVPAPDVAAAIGGRLPAWASVAPAPDGAPSYIEAFTDAARRLRDVDIPAEAWDPTKLPAHLRMTFRVHAERGAVLGEGKNLAELQRTLARHSGEAVQHAVRAAVRKAGKTPQQEVPADQSPDTGEKPLVGDWVVEESVAGRSHGQEVVGFPSLVLDGAPATGAAVTIRVLATADQQATEHPRAVRHLVTEMLALPVARVTSRWSTSETLALAASPYASTDALVADIQLAATSMLTADHSLRELRSRTEVESLAASLRERFEDAVLQVSRQAAAALTASRELDGEVRRATSMALLATLEDVRAHQSSLLGDGFISRTPSDQLPHLARYLKADVVRIGRAESSPARDAQLAWQVRELVDAWWAANAAAEHAPLARRSNLARVRWLIEELRVSLFAQQLGTAVTVSEKRIRKALAEA
ncbi:ATP-dependent RNA helicase HrpA [Pseudactinotalea terrae]|uniref:ATP-dependent RNA helicase HrpA n=1 Tax=Pseudactinotalea terrae TaxID=1743262 RepID=UPI0019D529FB